MSAVKDIQFSWEHDETLKDGEKRLVGRISYTGCVVVANENTKTAASRNKQQDDLRKEMLYVMSVDVAEMKKELGEKQGK